MDQQRLQDLIGPDYRLQWVIGNGGMSTVWLADDTRNDREVAIKVLRPEFSDNQEFLGRFRNEAATAQLINNTNVVRTYDYRELEDLNGAHFCFMAIEFIRGESLADRLARDKQLPEAEALDIMEQAAQGLAAIHEMGMVHRDIKPGNLMITQNGQVKITDFGIAKAAAAVPLTRTGMVVGTAQYVSPEQAQGHEVTSASDIYSLGVVGYEMLAGRRPFVGDSSVSVALAHISQAPEALSTTISAPARELIGIALRKDPATRYANGRDFSRAITAVRVGSRPPRPAGIPVADAPAPLSTSSAAASTQLLGAAGAGAGTGLGAGVGAGVAAGAGAGRGAGGAVAAGAATSTHGAGAVAAAQKGGIGRNIAIALSTLAMVVALGFGSLWLWNNRGGQETVPAQPSVVTQYVETPQQEQQPAVTTVTPSPRVPAGQEEPTLTQTTTVVSKRPAQTAETAASVAPAEPAAPAAPTPDANSAPNNQDSGAGAAAGTTAAVPQETQAAAVNSAVATPAGATPATGG